MFLTGTKRIDGRATASQIASAGRVVLVALHVRLDELRSHQANGVAQDLQLARPVVRARTGLHTDQTGRKVGKKRSDLVAPQLLAKHDLAVRVHAVHLEHVLGQIEADCRNLHGGRSFRFEWLLTLPLWHVESLS
jgi:hypothetical protein